MIEIVQFADAFYNFFRLKESEGMQIKGHYQNIEMFSVYHYLHEPKPQSTYQKGQYLNWF
ncbi:hypothetical protein CVS40_4298 [Lucilia cuprina]|nr:hypothetical protein CVS40_4298 [Lucilia cuprina]